MKTYWLKFGPDDPRSYTGLSPSFITFQTENGGTLAPPGVTERITGTGLYQFSHGSTLSISFIVDGGATLSLSNRYISGSLDPVQTVDQQLGYTTDSIGSTSVDPATAIAYLKRLREFLEGNATFNKTTGVWDIYSRGSTTLLVEKTLSDSSTTATKT